MVRITIAVSEEAFEALREFARAERRDPRAQAGIVLEEVMAVRAHLRSAEAEAQTSVPQASIPPKVRA